MRRATFGNLAVVMTLDGADACVADSRDRYSVDREVRSAGAHDLASVGRGVTQPNHVAHYLPFLVRLRIDCTVLRSIAHRVIRAVAIRLSCGNKRSLRRMFGIGWSAIVTD